INHTEDTAHVVTKPEKAPPAFFDRIPMRIQKYLKLNTIARKLFTETPPINYEKLDLILATLMTVPSERINEISSLILENIIRSLAAKPDGEDMTREVAKEMAKITLQKLDIESATPLFNKLLP